MIPFSILDLSPVTMGGNAAQSLRNTLDLARHAEGWGYQRLAKRYRCSRSSMHRHFRGSHNAASRPFEYNARANYERERMERERKP